MTTDQDLDAALALFNDGLERQKADRRAAKAIENAEKTKLQAAAELKRLQGDSGASPEDRAAAEAAYRDAVAAFNALRNGEEPPVSGAAAPDDGASDGGADAGAEDAADPDDGDRAASDETVASETSETPG